MPKRVLLVNKFYYPRGGDCVVVLNTEALLRENGVEAQVFAMEYPQNLPAAYQDRFASRVMARRQAHAGLWRHQGAL